MPSAALPLLTTRERDEARRIVEAQGLSFEEGADEVVGIYDQGRLVATGARQGYVLKMFAIDEAFQGDDLLGQLASALVESARRAGHEGVFVFTRPPHASSFERCGFRLLVATGRAALLEHGSGLEEYLRKAGLPRRSAEGAEAGEGAKVGEGAKAGAIVLNGNPFTLGHQYLVETAAARVEQLFLFVVREDRSIFPFEVRYRMAQAGTAHLRNVVLLDTSRYAVSAGTFPSYFLRRRDEAAAIQMEIDARLFGARLAPAFGISRRFVGQEPYCETTAAYNEVLARVLPEYGVSLEEVPRLGDETGFVSATRVRAALEAGDLPTVARLVPPTTLALLG